MMTRYQRVLAGLWNVDKRTKQSLPFLVPTPSIPSPLKLRHSLTEIKTFTSSASSEAAAAPVVAPIVELRQYQLHPNRTALYTQSTIQSSRLRRLHLPLAFFGYPESGSILLNTAVHLYNYSRGHSERLEQRSRLAKIGEWKDYLGEVKGCMIQQSSSIFLEAKFLKDFEGVSGLGHWVDRCGAYEKANNVDCHNSSERSRKIIASNSQSSIIELRKYQLQLGYDTVPKFIELYSQALPSKLKAPGTHPTTQLVTVLVSDVGSLNCVLEIWKHGGHFENDSACGVAAMEQSRQASRGAGEWRRGIAEIAKLAVTFESTVLKPSEFSPLQ